MAAQRGAPTRGYRKGGGCYWRTPAAAAVAFFVSSAYLNLQLLQFASMQIAPRAVPADDAPRPAFSNDAIGARSSEAGEGRHLRVVAFCACPARGKSELDVQSGKWRPFHTALQRMAALVPEIAYIGMFDGREGPCEPKIEEWWAHNTDMRGNGTVQALEVLYTDGHGEQCYPPRNLALETGPPSPPKWVGGLHLPSASPVNVKVGRRRLEDWGEVNQARNRRCDPMDSSVVYLYRSRTLWDAVQEANCTVVHYPAALMYAQHYLAYRMEEGTAGRNETIASILSRTLTESKARKILESKSQFSLLLTMTTMQAKYSADALVRHALCHLLTKRRPERPCHAVRSWKKQGIENLSAPLERFQGSTYKVQKPYKFVIAMPNRFQEGYIAEKTMHPYFANAVAVTSIPRIGKYVNAAGMITCDISPAELEKVERYNVGYFMWMPFNTTPEMWESRKVMPIEYDPYANDGQGDKPILDFAIKTWEEALKPCVDEVVRLDEDDEAFIQKIMQPYVQRGGEGSLFDGTYVALSLLGWFVQAESPLVSGLEGKIARLGTMRDQTAG